ncbi:MAG: HAD-IA family hydrolase [Trueperaceae bacterium]
MTAADAGPIRAIAFDWGGIFTEGTFDSDAIINLAALCEVSEERIAEHYFPLMAELETGAFDVDDFVARFQTESGISFEPERFRSTFLASGRERPAMYRLLAAIPAGYSVAVLSNNVPLLCDRVRDDERMKRVDTFLFSNELGVRKPDPAAYAALAEALGLPPREIVFIDDSADNIRACRDLGFNGIHLRGFSAFLAEFAQVAPDVPLADVHG